VTAPSPRSLRELTGADRPAMFWVVIGKDEVGELPMLLRDEDATNHDLGGVSRRAH
jgi:hypothetical protein